MGRPSQVVFIRLAKATAVIVALSLCMAFVPLGMAVLMPFVALPLAHVVTRGGLRQGVPLAVVSAALVWMVTGVGMSSLILFLLLGLGLFLGEGIRRSWPFGRTLAATASAALCAFVLWGAMLWQLGLDATQLREAAFASIDRAAQTYAGFGVSADTTEVVSGQMRALIGILPYLAPGLLGMAVILLAACTIGLAYLLFPRLRERVEVRTALSGFRMHWSAAYLSIVGLAMVVFARGDGTGKTAMLFAGINLLLVAQTLFFLQGLAVIHWLAKARRARPGARAALYVAAVLGQAFFQATGLLGLFDTWLDWRKRFALKSPPAGASR